MRIQTVCILGGTGFVGRQIANRLANTPIHIKVLTRRRERNRHLLPIPNLELVETDIHDAQQLAAQLEGVDAVINLVAILNESKKPGRDFETVHVRLVEKLLEACQTAGVKRLLHMSALGADIDGPSRYQQTKGEGERLALAANGDDLAVTVFKPSVVFGPADSFLNTFAGLLRMAPVMPLPTPEAKFQPVYVDDVAAAFETALSDRRTFGRTYELGGPTVYSLKTLVRYVAELLGVRRAIVGLPDGLSRLQGRIMQRVPGQPYTYDNYLSAQVDNVCSHNALPDLGIHPTALEAVAPGYLGGQKSRDRYDEWRRDAGRHSE
ncbi:complex I NDUFA9 subunit family protein [Spiribacter aquaticus]|uniref:Complex I NDUFA9 subunit family protein n=1 Tax=Spiribacter aquaticus TaxID=1935996 RepID=A0A557RMQ9_9GAMM|nr:MULTISPECIES: complex I NDUFA9 subunit family protein [Spiribacter]KAF0279444.1 epimerase [Spiribacter roseus]KAF0281825.1 epimerase [Spiribacter roseus]TVO66398.1 complex I NDUFA9 subunit family protein [Spiribacter aquaticus]